MVERVNWPKGFAVGLSGGCSYGFSSRVYVEWFCYQTAERFRRQMSRATLEFSSLFRRSHLFFPRRAHILLLLRLLLAPVKTR